MTKPYLSVIIPAYNESSIILENVLEIEGWLKDNLQNKTFEIMVIDDGSSDNMGKLLDDAAKKYEWLNIVHHPVNFGRGRAVRTGFAESKGDYIICLDADLSYSPDHIRTLLEPLVNGEADITLASAHHPEGQIINVPAQREFLSKWGNRLLGWGFGGDFYTVTCIVRGFTRDVLDALELVGNGKDVHLEVIQKAKLLGYNIMEVPATLKWRDRKRGKSKKRKLLPEIAIFKMRKTVISHLIFNYISNPGILLLVPILLLFSVILIGFGMLISAFLNNIEENGLGLIQILRQTLIDGQLTLTVVFFTFMILMIFVVFYFLSSQNKRYFDEIYTLMMRMNKRIKRIEKNRDDID